MTTTEDVIILKVGTDQAVKSVGDLKNNIKELKKQLDGYTEATGEIDEQGKKVYKTIEGLTIGSEEYKQVLEELKINQNALRDAMYATTASMEDVMAAAQGANIKWNEQNKLVNKGNLSYNELVHTMAALKEEWRATNDQARRDEIGAQIAEINQQLKEMDASVGNYQRNVGNYEGALEKLAGGFMATAGGAGAVINPIKNVTMGFKALSATPVIGILGLLANVLTMIIKNLNTSEENTNRLTIAFAPLKTSATIMTRTFQWLGDKLADVAEWMTKVLGKLGLISKLGGELQEIAKEEIALVEERRKVEMKNADTQLEIAQLKAKTAEKDKYTAKERLAFIEETAKKEREIADRNIEIARREYAVLEEKSKLAGNSKEENDKLKDAYVKLQQAETDYLNKTRELNSQRVEAINSIKAEKKETEELIEEKIKLADFDKALAKGNSVIKERFDAEKAEIAAMDAWWADELSSVDDDVSAMFEEHVDALLESNQTKAKLSAKDIVATTMSVADATSGILSSIADMYEADEKNSEKNAKKIKTLRIASATIDMLNGAVGAFSQANATLPPPAGAIVGAANAAAVIAMGIANINKIKSTNVSGDGGGSVSATSAVVNPPSVDTNIPMVKTATSASEEERLNRMASPQKVYILQSDIEAAGSQSKVQIEESSF